MTQSTWCTVADVALLTGKTVTDDQLLQGNATLELALGRTYFEMVGSPQGGQAALGRRDLEWIRRACAYQVAWQVAQPDMFVRLDATSFPQGPGLSEQALTLAPLARRALRRVSWLRSRSLQVRGAFSDGSYAADLNALAEANDANESWSPLGSQLEGQVG